MSWKPRNPGRRARRKSGWDDASDFCLGIIFDGFSGGRRPVDVRFCLVSAGPDQERCVWPDGYDSKLTVVIGGEAKDITTAEAAAHIFGYVCLNDVSDRATQVDAEGQQHLARAKSRPTYCPIGPYLTTGVDGMNLNMWAKLNGQFEQQGNTDDMLFNIYEMVAYFSTP